MRLAAACCIRLLRLKGAAAERQYGKRRGERFFAHRQTAIHHMFDRRPTILLRHRAGIIRDRSRKAIAQFCR